MGKQLKGNRMKKPVMKPAGMKNGAKAKPKGMMKGGMAKGKPMYMKKGGKMEMTKKDGKSVPAFAADGVGKMKRGGKAKTKSKSK
jgi:hypothetical protein